METNTIAICIGLLAGAIFFIDGWGPSEKGVSFIKSRRFRGLSIIISGSVIAPVMDYLLKSKQPDFFLHYLQGCVFGWFMMFILGLVLYILWNKSRGVKNTKVVWVGELGYSVLDFIYLGISDNPHLNAKREYDISVYKTQADNELKRLKEALDQRETSPTNVDDATRKQLQEYEQKLRSLKTESDYDFNDWYYKGVSEFEKHEFEKSIAYMKNALEKKASELEVVDANLYIGSSYFQLGLYDKMLESSEKITVLSPDISSGWINKGTALLNLRKYEESLQALNRAEELDPLDGYIWYNRACLHAVLDEKDKALSDLKKAIELTPEFKKSAKDNIGFNNIKEDQRFIDLLS
jgi:tetratricopeptide (TPR) repeat protein